MRRYVALLGFASLGCAPDTTGPGHDERWESYPSSEVRFEGPTPRISAFLAPLSELPGLRAVVIITNPGSDSLRVYYGPCDFGMRLYSSPSLIGSPNWDNRVDGCDAVLFWLDVPPGESRTKPMYAYVDPAQLANNLPSGRYHAAVTWRTSLKSRVQMVPAGEVIVP